MRATDRSGLAVMLSVMLATITVLPLTSERGFLVLSWLLIAVIGTVSLALRRLRLGGGTVLGVQTMVLVLASVGLSQLLGSAVAGGSWFERYPDLWGVGIEHMRTQASPMAPNVGVTLIFVTTIGLILIMTDLLVLGVGRPAWSIAPPATLFLVPALGLGTDTGVFNFLLIAAGYLLILTAEGLNTTARWTRGLSRDSAEGHAQATPVVWRAAGLLAVPAVGLTVILGIALPTLSLPGLGIGNGPGNGPLQLTDPTLDLKRNLNQPQNRTVIEYQTDQPGGLYLRLATLPRLSDAGWGNVQIRLNTGKQLSAVPGLTVDSQPRHSSIRVLDFGSQYLPLPYAPRSFDAAGDWRFDASSLVVVKNNDNAEDLRGLSYTVDSVDIAPDGPGLAQARVGNPDDDGVTEEVPSDLPRDLVQLAREVAKDADTPAAKAAAIQAYLRSDRFEYTLDPQPGTGYTALDNFLTKDRKGYCEQFASAMAMMARVNGIPSRVSVGFLPGSQDGNTYKVAIRDMHAWPELYFADYGWVRFEPTPSVRTGAAPPWTIRGQDAPTNPSESPSAAPTAASAAPSQRPDVPAESTTPTDTDSESAWRKPLVGSALGLLGLVVLAAPATIRIRRRSGRLASEGLAEDQVEAAWAEIRDSVLDYGGSWPSGSPRSIGQSVGERLEQPESASMARVATLVERTRYAPALGDAADDLPQLTTDVRRGLAAPQSWWRRGLAFILPRSLFRRGQRE